MTVRRLVTALVAGAITLVVVPASASRPAPRGLSGPGSVAPPSTSGRPAFVPGEVLVRFADRLPTERARAAVAAAGARLSERIERFDVGVAQLHTGVTVATGIARLEEAPGVVSAEPNFLRYPSQVAPTDDDLFPQQWSLRNISQVHDVTDYPDYVTPPPAERAGKLNADIDAEEAWSVSSGDSSVVIAVLDSGVDVTHRDLDDNLWDNIPEVSGAPGVDDDGNGYTDDEHGYDFTGSGDPDVLDDETFCRGLDRPRCFGWDHGTHVAGIAAAEDNAEGIVGVCPHCRLMVLKFFKPIDTNRDGVPDTMSGSVSAELEALDYAATMGADLVNGSFGSALWSAAERSAFQELGRNGVLTVLAAGNMNGDNDSYYESYFDSDLAPDSMGPFYPAAYNLPTLISVAATDDDDKYANATECVAEEGRGFPCSFTNWGRNSVDIAAPGTDITSTVPVTIREPEGYATWDGTSMAAPVVSGVAGLVMSRPLALSSMDVKNAIMNSAERPDSLKQLRAWPDRYKTFNGSFTRTNGRVDALGAVTTTDFSNATPVNDGDINGAKRIFSRSQGSVSFPGDENDVYKKRLRKGRSYVVDLNGPRGDNFALWVYKPGVKDIWQYQASCDFGGSACRIVGISDGRGADEGGRFKASATGTYYFHVHAHVRSEGRYTLKVGRI